MAERRGLELRRNRNASAEYAPRRANYSSLRKFWSGENAFWSGLTLFGVAGLGYLLLKGDEKPDDGAAPPLPIESPPAPPATSAPPIAGDSKVCANGLTIPATATCMRACPGGASVPETAACPPMGPPMMTPPVVTHIVSGPPLDVPPPLGPIDPSTSSQLIPSTGLPPWLATFPFYKPAPDPSETIPVSILPGDALVFIQGYAQDGTPVYQGVVYPSIVLRGSDVPAVASNIEALLDPTKEFLARYYSAPFIAPLETPSSTVLVWTTDAAGNVLAWWLMNWTSP